MSTELTPEAARAAAEWLEDHDRRHAADALLTEARRLDAMRRTLGEVLYLCSAPAVANNWADTSPDVRALYEARGAVVVEHYKAQKGASA